LGDSLIVPKALEVAQPGDIIVIDAKGSCNNGVWGDNRSRVAKAIGLAGVVIDGAFRDIEENEALGFPIYARANTCGRSTRGAKGEVNVPISCGGVSVRPGDIIVGDRNGVVVIPLEHAEEIIQAAQEQVDKMEAQIAKFEATGQIIPDSLEKELKRLGY
ncbi:MAG: RraA family protein, partial [Trichococcus flocculiformis]